MEVYTDDKLVIMGAAGMLGSNMAQCALMMGLTSNLCLYDPHSQGLKGVTKEMKQAGFDYANISFTSDIKTALTDARYIVSSGSAPSINGLGRESLLEYNAEIAAQLGRDIKTYCTDIKHLTVVFNPSDICGLITLVLSGIHPSKISTLAALDSTRFQCALAEHFNMPLRDISGCRTYGEHGGTMALFASSAKVAGMSLLDMIGTSEMTVEQWQDIKTQVKHGGAEIVKLRGRSSFQSPAYLAIQMIKAAMGGKRFTLPVGAYANNADFKHIMMALDTTITDNGVTINELKGTPEEFAELNASYKHLCTVRNEMIESDILPKIEDWTKYNANL